MQNSNGQSKGALQSFGRWVADVDDAWPEQALSRARLAAIDTVACMMAGAGDAAVKRCYAAIADWGTGPCHQLGAPRLMAAPWAALINGTAAHALDFDDNFDPAKAHASAVLWPAILALGEQQQASGHDCLNAYIVGLELLGRFGQALNPPHRDRGWHATATLGAVASAAACARLLRLEPNQAATALSIATSQAAGFMAQFGSMTKPIHAGFAAKAGIMAASLARAGVTAGMEILAGRTAMDHLWVGQDIEALRSAQNFEAHFGETLSFEPQRLGQPLLILEYGLKPKLYPNCASAHRALDALSQIMDAHRFGATAVERIDVFLPGHLHANLMYPDPQNGAEAKFSLEYALSVLLATGTNRLEDFTDNAARDPARRRYMARIHAHPGQPADKVFPTRVEVTLTDGQKFAEEVLFARGSHKQPLNEAAHWRKLEDCAQKHMSAENYDNMTAALREFDAKDHKPVAQLMQALTG